MANVHSEGLLWSIPRSSRSRRGGALAPSLAIHVLWGDDLIAVRHLSPPRAFTVGGAGSDLALAEELDWSGEKPLVEVEYGDVFVLQEGGERVRLELGQSLLCQHAGLTFRFELAPAEGRFPRATLDGEWLGYFALSALSTLGFIAAVAMFVPPLGLVDDELLDRERFATMLQYLNAQAERERLSEAEPGQSSGAPSTPSEGQRGESGELGKRDAPRQNRRFASNAPPAERDTSREAALREATTFGFLGLLASSAPMLPGVQWDRDGALNRLDQVAFGNLFGSDIGEAAGSGGFGISGTGSGSGGLGTGIGIGSIGTCQSLNGCGNGEGGWGRSRALASGVHQGKGPSVRMARSAEVSGRLPPEVVQRVVRQNFGRFRQCYERGLSKNPTLNGRVTARFVIDRSGAVTLAQNGGSDLPDSGVVACVVNTFYGLSFPAPDNGTVRVSYPILFSVG